MHCIKIESIKTEIKSQINIILYQTVTIVTWRTMKLVLVGDSVTEYVHYYKIRTVDIQSICVIHNVDTKFVWKMKNKIATLYKYVHVVFKMKFVSSERIYNNIIIKSQRQIKKRIKIVYICHTLFSL